MNVLALSVEVLGRHATLKLLDSDSAIVCLLFSLLTELLLALGLPLFL